MRTRVPTVAGLLRVVGLAGAVAGCVLAVAALSKTWAVDGPREGQVAPKTGWDALGYGALVLAGACGLVVILATALCVGPRSRKTSRTAGGLALFVLLAALAGVGIGYWLSGLDFSFFSDDPSRQYDTGPGYGDAATALGIAVLGLLVLLAGRWEARTRKALRREAAAAAAAGVPPDPEPEPSWLARA